MHIGNILLVMDSPTMTRKQRMSLRLIRPTTLLSAVVLIATCMTLLPIIVDSKTQMFDLIVDPHESESTHGDTTYDDVKLYMESRIPSYWVDAMVEPDNDDNTGQDIIMQQWDNCHATCPWTLNTAMYEIEQIYSYPKAPHIVFILVDDWGYNDVGYRSTSMTWTTPTINKLAGEGIILNNYFSHETCTPSRGALLTGRLSVRLGLQGGADEFGPELPLSEVTLAQELKSAGYKTNLVGKWHLGMSSAARTPTYRGFDYFYGYYNSYIDYWTKTYQGYIDIHEGLDPVLDASALDDNLFSQILFQKKAEDVIKNHAENYKALGIPMFLLYSMQIVSAPYQVPPEYSSRCTRDGNLLDDDAYCGMNVLLDEAVANITCTLEAHDMSENTVLIVASDNGGAKTATAGTNVPYRGYKGDVYRGGISVNAFIHSPLIPASARGLRYDGQMHVTDWLPTLMGLATKGTWAGSIAGPEITIDGKDMWNALITNDDSPRHEILHMIRDEGLTFSIQYDMVKLDTNNDIAAFGLVSITYAADFAPENAHFTCPIPTLMIDSTGVNIVKYNDDNWGGPSQSPTQKASSPPTYAPPTMLPTMSPTISIAPTKVAETNPPTLKPIAPSAVPTAAPVATKSPTMLPTIEVTESPTEAPTTSEPTFEPSAEPTFEPTTATPSALPTKATPEPSSVPTAPTFSPSTRTPTPEPSAVPTLKPSGEPSFAPTKRFDLKLFVSHNLSYGIVGIVGLAWAIFFIVRYCPCCKCCETDEEAPPVTLKTTNDKTPLLKSGEKVINNRIAGGAANAAFNENNELSFFSNWGGFMGRS